MGRKSRKNYFWISYSDLMTSLFFVMLILFVYVTGMLNKSRIEADKSRIEAEKSRIEAEIKAENLENKLKEIKRVQESTRDLEGKYFVYDEDFEKYRLNISVKYPVGISDISYVDSKARKALSKAGEEIRNFLKNHSSHQYLLVVEGQASSDSYYKNYELSYERALGLIRFWLEKCKYSFGNNCEIQIAGSGDGKLNLHTMREEEEYKNQRFLIYILPKNIFKEDL